MSQVAVIGGGLGGMTAAAELARNGHRVRLHEATSALGGKARAVAFDGVRLDTGPTLLTLPEVVRSTFARLGSEDLLPKLTELELQCDYRFADGSRFLAHRDLDQTVDEANKLGNEEGEGLRRFYKEAAGIYQAAGEPYLEAPFEGMLEFMGRVAKRGLSAVGLGMRMGTLQELAETCFRSEALRQFAGRFATYAGASPFEASAAFALIAHIERAHGVYHVEGGMGALTEAFEKVLGRLGVEVVLDSRARWQAEGGKFLVDTGGRAERFDAVVVNQDPLASLGRSKEALSMSGYVLLLRANRRVRLPHHTVLFAEDYRSEFRDIFDGRVPANPTLYVCHPSATDDTLSLPDRSGLFVMVNVPPLDRHDAHAARDWVEKAELLRALVLRRLRERCPELSDARLEVLGERTPVDWAELGSPNGSLYGFLPHGKFGPFRRPRIRGSVPGLYFSGGGTHPGGGVPLVMLSGRFAANLAQHHLGASV